MDTYKLKVDVVYPENKSVYLDLYKNDKKVADSINFELESCWCYICEESGLILQVLFRAGADIRDTLQFLIDNPKLQLVFELD